MESNKRYERSVYAGILGKIIGVYLGRPIEGWPYLKIKDTFGTITNYINKEVGVPLVVADDDVAGTFVFLNAAEDSENLLNLSSEEIGESWLNYVIENKTIFWWGGLGRSTEHTAFLRLKSGIKAPKSGSIEINGEAVASQIGAQIFCDAYAMMCPGDPERARYLIKQLASVSHDGIAVEAACFFGSMEAVAFEEKNLENILDTSILYCKNDHLLTMIADVRNFCFAETDWRKVRNRINEKYGYHLYPGNCHIIPNQALMLASILLGGEDFQKSLQITVSGGWDTDCNAANVGCFNGIRLGLEKINNGADLRGPIADRLYLMSSDGGRCVSDAVQQTRRVVSLNHKLYKTDGDSAKARFSFEMPGSVQGFQIRTTGPATVEDVTLFNRNQNSEENALCLSFTVSEKGRSAAASTPVLWDLEDIQSNYCLIGSPTLYPGQTVKAKLRNHGEAYATVKLFVSYYDRSNQIKHVWGPENGMKCNEEIQINWEVPDLKGMPAARIGFEVCGRSVGDKIQMELYSLDWKGTPKRIYINGPIRNYDLEGELMAIQSWTASANQFSSDADNLFCVSHDSANGLVTIGTEDWDNYSVTSDISYSIHDFGGIVVRCKGHRKYYAAVLSGHKEIVIYKMDGEKRTVLAKTEYPYQENRRYSVTFLCHGSKLSVKINGDLILQTEDYTFSHGGAGFVIERGTMLVKDFLLESV